MSSQRREAYEKTNRTKFRRGLLYFSASRRAGQVSASRVSMRQRVCGKHVHLSITLYPFNITEEPRGFNSQINQEYVIFSTEPSRRKRMQLFKSCAQVLGLATGLLAMGLTLEAHAKGNFPTLIPNGWTNACATCHPGATSRNNLNAFGRDVQSNLSPNRSRFEWSDLCDLDSDNDGATNGLELGDPDCDGTPTPGLQVFWPGDATSTPDLPMGGEPAPAAGEPVPAAGEPAPAAGEPEPAAGEPAPAAGEPEPAAGEPAPAAGEPEPAAGEPAPAAGEPAPAAGEPEPSAGESAPAAGEPEPSAGEPEPSAGEPVQAAGEAASSAGESAPEGGEPTPEGGESAPGDVPTTAGVANTGNDTPGAAAAGRSTDENGDTSTDNQGPVPAVAGESSASAGTATASAGGAPGLNDTSASAGAMGGADFGGSNNSAGCACDFSSTEDAPWGSLLVFGLFLLWLRRR